MKFVELSVLLPCHSLEDFPLDNTADEALGLLDAWTALWHPALVANAGTAPSWHRADAPPADLAGRLLVVPTASLSRLPEGLTVRADAEGALLVCQPRCRQEIIDKALAAIGGAADIDPDLAADFLALGYCRLQVELLTRQMRYASNIDETEFNKQLVAAAEAAVAADRAMGRTHLKRAFELLHESRKYFYPVDSYLIDLTLVAPTTIGPALARQLEDLLPTNLLVSGELLEKIAHQQPATLQALLAALSAGHATLVGGESHERELPLLPLENIAREFVAGSRQYEAWLGRRPRVFGRRRFGLSPTLPQILARFGFQGALHFTLDDGHFPLGQQCKMRWEGAAATTMDAVLRLPRDAAKPETFLDLARKLGETMDSDHVATVLLAHWPGLTSSYYDDLRRVARYSSVLGKFITLDEYFQQTYLPGQNARFTADDYRAPYLQQAVIRRENDPISRIVAMHRQAALRQAVETIDAWTLMLSRAARLQESSDAIANASFDDAELQRRLTQSVAALARALPRNPQPATTATLFVNTLAHARRQCLSTSGSGVSDESPGPAGPTRLLQSVETPGCGFARLEVEELRPTTAKRDKPLAADNVLGNEFFEITLSPTGGGIQSVHDRRQRSNRLSQQVALRIAAGTTSVPGETWRDPAEDALYSQMSVEAIEVTSAGPSVGEIVSRGNLLDGDGRKLAGFRQTTQVCRGSRVIRVVIELDPTETLRADPWNSYYAARFAWSDASADLYRGVQLACHSTDAKRIEAPEYIEIDSGSARTTILTGGHPYHRRTSLRTLDSLLIVRGESARQFTLGIGIDLPNSARAAQELLTPAIVCDETTAPLAGGPSGWLFHLDARHVVTTHWAPYYDDGVEAAAAPVGFCVRLLETAGRGGTVTLRAFRELASAEKIDFQGQSWGALVVESDRIVCELAGHEWAEIRARWKT